MKVEQASRYPKPCAQEFDYMASTNPKMLDEWIRSGELEHVHVSFAAEALGGADDVAPFVDTLLSLLCHASSIIREGAVFGLGRQCCTDPSIVSWLQITSLLDPSMGVRSTARDVLENALA